MLPEVKLSNWRRVMKHSHIMGKNDPKLLRYPYEPPKEALIHFRQMRKR